MLEDDNNQLREQEGFAASIILLAFLSELD